MNGIVAISFLIVVCLAVPTFGGFIEDYKFFYSCKGEDTGMANRFFKVNTVFAECSGRQGRYCQFRCVGLKMGWFEKKPGAKSEYNFVKDLNEFSKKDEFRKATNKCDKGVQFKEEDKCFTTRQLINCFKNAFNKICNNAMKDEFNDQKESNEGLLSGLGLGKKKSLDNTPE